MVLQKQVKKEKFQATSLSRVVDQFLHPRRWKWKCYETCFVEEGYDFKCRLPA